MSDMNGIKASSIEKFCIENNISFTKFDYFGHGDSDGKFLDGTIEQWLNDALLIFDKVTHGKQILIGSSMGSWIMFLLYLLREKKIAGLIGLASAPDFTKNYWKSLNENAKQILKKEGIYFEDSKYSPEKTPITYKLILNSQKFYIMDRKIKIKCPVVLFHGLKDTDVHFSNSLELAEKITSSNFTLNFLPNGDHRLSKPEEIESIIYSLSKMHSAS